jgi:hypothetical protein
MNEFSDEYQRYLRFYNAIQVGLPSFFLSKKVANSREFLEFSSCLQRLLDSDCYELVERGQGLAWKGYEYKMAHIYVHALKTKVFNGASDVFLTSAENVFLINDFCRVYGELFELIVEFVEGGGIDRRRFAIAVAINVVRLNRRPYAILDLEENLSKIESPIGLIDPLYDCLERKVKCWSTLVFSCGVDSRIPFWISATMNVFYDIASGVFVVKRCDGETVVESLCGLWSVVDANDVMSFYSDVWSILNE